MTPQINHLRKAKATLRVATHIYGVSKKIDRKTGMLKVNLGMWPLKSIVSENWFLFCCCNTHFWGFQANSWLNVHVQLSSLCNRLSWQIHPLYSILDFSEILHCMFSKHVSAEKVVLSCSYSSQKIPNSKFSRVLNTMEKVWKPLW